MKIVINGNTNKTPEANELLATQGNHWLNLLACLGHDLHYPPLGEFLKSYHRLDGDWIVMTPIHWEATHNDAMITAAGNALNISNGQELFAVIKQFFDEDTAFTLYYHDEIHWMLKARDKSSPNSPAVHQILHQSLLPVLAAMDETLYWQRLFTELQMYLANHPINIKRTESLPINGVWFYGKGVLTLPSPFSIYSDDDSLIKAFPQQVLPLSKEVDCTKNTIVLLKDEENCPLISKKAIESGIEVQWYWNNIAYKTPKTNKIKKWWRKLFYANKKKNNQ